MTQVINIESYFEMVLFPSSGKLEVKTLADKLVNRTWFQNDVTNAPCIDIQEVTRLKLLYSQIAKRKKSSP